MTVLAGQPEAIAKRAPHAPSSGFPTQVESGPINATGTPIQAIKNPASAVAFYWVTLSPDVDCFVAFGATAGMAAATTSCWSMSAGEKEDFWCSVADDSWFSVIQKTGAGTMRYYKSNV